MPLSFLNPLALVGVAGTAIPLLIHLIQKKPALPRPFAAMEFILKSHKRAGRRYRIKQILLLILRMTAVALLALTISGPIWRAREVPAFGESLPTHWVLIIDDSFSMGFKDNFEKAKNVAFKILEEVKEKDKIDLLLVSGRAHDNGPKEETTTKQQLQNAIKNLSLTYSPGSIIQALEESQRILADASPELNQRLILITDLTLNSWQGQMKGVAVKAGGPGKLGGKLQLHMRLDIIDVGDPEGQPNHTIKDIKVFFPPGGEKELAILEFKVVNFSNEDVNNLPASLSID
ncbi:MAG: BatA domain-containing protein, partial [Candidatus Tectomicrobia bacterium]|nr:BatA domain-containing protein [Candidatus Tectomicrobia bacterium]